MTPKLLLECIKNNKIKKIKVIVTMYLGGYPENVIEFFNIKKKKSEGLPPVKICKSCNAVNIASAKICTECGTEFEQQVKKEIETKLEELIFKRCLNKYLYDLSINDFMQVAKTKKYKLQYIERILFHVHGIESLNNFWNNKNYKEAYRYRRLQIYRTENKPLNFKIKL
jgi:ribosomal protein L40E